MQGEQATATVPHNRTPRASWVEGSRSSFGAYQAPADSYGAARRGGFKLSYSKIVKLACCQAIWAAFMSPIPRMAMAGLGGGVDVDFRSPAVTAPDSQTGVGELRDGDAPGGRSRVMFMCRDYVLTLERSRAYKGCCWNGRAGVRTFEQVAQSWC